MSEGLNMHGSFTATESSAVPIAVVGIGCRLPGDADNPVAFWELLRSGGNTTSDIPEDRWRSYAELGARHASVLRSTVRRGSFLSGIDGFDADFFGVSPREAELMDPQQRILLEVAWEALEHAGIPPRSLAGSDTSVFVGACTDDYRRRLLEDVVHMDAWTGIGAARCAVANRISHALDLRGPSLAVDTACSASLVALHLACQSLRSSESGLALVAGVNLLLSPGETITLDLAGALASDGRSKAFDATADGYGRGEGCGVVVLKLLADAQRDGDRVLAVVRGSAVSQDGYTNGIMAPNRAAQEDVMALACRNAGVDPRTVGFVEAHGTGTLLGDPQEAAALSAVYGVDRADDGCFIGSVKTNIGHLEGAAGVASVIKAVLALWHAEIPASPLVSVPNPAIPWQDNGLRIATAHMAWPEAAQPRRASVSGFGYGGTIAHIVLEQAPTESLPPRSSESPGRRMFVLSAASEEALRRRADDLAGWLSMRPGEIPLDSLAHTLAIRRSHLEHRAAVIASGEADLIEKLGALAKDEPVDDAATGVPLPGRDDGLVWVFSGHGSQWAGMGRELLATEPAFAAVLDELAPVFAEEIGFTPREALASGDLDDVSRIQAMIFAMQVGLAEVLRSYGVTPAAVIGHSVGEIAAAVAAGALDLTAGARLSCRRSTLLRREAGSGSMAMVGLPFAEVESRLTDRPGLCAAIHSSPTSTVVSGDPDALDVVLEEWRAQGVVIRRVASDVAFHSPRMDPLAAELAEAVSELRPASPRIPFYTTALPDSRSVPLFDGAYWAANLRNPVRLVDAVTAAAGDGYRAFLEISPHPVVTHSISETLSELGTECAFVDGTLRRDRSERQRLLSTLGALHCHGFPIDWSRLYPTGTLIEAPVNPWRHRSLWWRPQLSVGTAAQHDPDSRTLLGAETTVVGSPIRVWQSSLDDSTRPYPGSHSINGVEIVPAAVFLSSFFEAAAPDSPPPALRGIAMHSPLMTAEHRHIQVVLDGDSVRLASRAENADPRHGWVTHVEATAAAPSGELSSGPLPAVSLEKVPVTMVHDRLSAVGVPSTGFDWTVVELLRGRGALRGTVTFEREDLSTWAPLLDAVMSLAPVAYPGAPVLRMVVEADEIAVLGEPPKSAVIDIAVRADRPDAVDVTVIGPDDTVSARITGLRYAVIGAEHAGVSDKRALVHELVWRPWDHADGSRSDRPLLLVGRRDTMTDHVIARADAVGRTARLVADLDQAGDLAETDVLLILPVAATWDAAEAQLSSLVGATQRLAETSSARLWCLTTGAVRTGGVAEPEFAPAGAVAAGFSRTVTGTGRGLRGGLIDLDGLAAAEPSGTARIVLDLIGSALDEAVVAVRQGQPHVPRVAGVVAQPADPPARCRPEATYLVVGGPTPLGLAAADRLVELGARRILFAMPEQFPARAQWESAVDERVRSQVDGVRALEARGVTVRVVDLDIADPAQVAELADPDWYGLPAIRGIVCVTAPAGEPPITDRDAQEVPALRSRAYGPWLLHELFPVETLDFLTFFTSGEQALGVPALPADGAACALVDALAVHRAGQGERALSVGVLADQEIGPADAVAAWDAADGRGLGACLVFRSASPELLERGLSVLTELVALQEDPADSAEEADELATLDPKELLDKLTAEVRAHIAKEMRLAPADLSPTRSLAEQGLDSILTVMVRRRLEKRFECRLPATLLWHTPTVVAIAEHVAELLSSSAREANPRSDAVVPAV
ncbi:acyltransferase domain-containing protein [Nocardia sp. NEAU-G5]|uniref:Acyltransferase domain-containing protein n=1 Tax=Nocardia albiluteola TaxID=2842303 RepID=A0ABS6AXE7_9NOCA|nr:type I polyketide synthase [Nocardia albiluteola]MBU3062191.1 acyltransferase domain-containing protein [Nocardia albiluteola]